MRRANAFCPGCHSFEGTERLVSEAKALKVEREFYKAHAPCTAPPKKPRASRARRAR